MVTIQKADEYDLYGEISEQIIPEEFDDVFLMYNDLQQSQGFDLENYKGKSVKRYSYLAKKFVPHTCISYPRNEMQVFYAIICQ